MVYGLGSLPFKQRDGVRISVGSLRIRHSGVAQRAGPVAVNHVIGVRITAPEPW